MVLALVFRKTQKRGYGIFFQLTTPCLWQGSPCMEAWRDQSFTKLWRWSLYCLGNPKMLGDARAVGHLSGKTVASIRDSRYCSQQRCKGGRVIKVLCHRTQKYRIWSLFWWCFLMSVPLPPLKDINAYSVPLCARVCDLPFNFICNYSWVSRDMDFGKLLRLKDYEDFWSWTTSHWWPGAGMWWFGCERLP